MPASKFECELNDLKLSHNNVLLVFYKLINDAVKFSTSEITLNDTQLIFHNKEMKEMLVQRIATFVQDYHMTESEFVEKFMVIFETINNSKD